MSEVLPPPLSPSRKRPFSDNDDVPQATPSRDNAASPSSSSILSTPLTIASLRESPLTSAEASARQTSPAPSSSTSVSVDRPEGVPASASTPGAVSAKRRKLTAQEKEDKRLEKEAKENAKAEAKAKKEEEKRVKDEERKKKAEEKEEKKRMKEYELQQKEEEKRKKDEEKQKKERSQLRLNAFFTKPSGSKAAAVASPAKPKPSAETSATPPNALSSQSDGLVPSQETILLSPSKKSKTDYELYFLPFEAPSNTVCAPYNRFVLEGEELEAARRSLDDMNSTAGIDIRQSMLFRARETCPRSRGATNLPVREIMARLHGSSANPIDLTEDKSSTTQPLELLLRVPMKYLHFGEDVRPAYYGTFTKLQTRQEARKLSRNPFSQLLPEANYEYDSEAEWEEPEEGEDLDSDGEEDMEDDAEDDMEDFLDDDDAAENKRRLITGDLEPISTGLCWEDARGISRKADNPAEAVHDFAEFRMGILLDPRPQSIDPFSTAYWDPAPAASTSPPRAASETKNSLLNLMQPPRLPLTMKPNGANLNQPDIKNKKISSVAGKSSQTPQPPKRLIPPEQMQAFKEEIQGSDMTKIAIIEHLKKKFPTIPKDAISNTLVLVAKREGAKACEKRWRLIEAGQTPD